MQIAENAKICIDKQTLQILCNDKLLLIKKLLNQENCNITPSKPKSLRNRNQQIRVRPLFAPSE